MFSNKLVFCPSGQTHITRRIKPFVTSRDTRISRHGTTLIKASRWQAIFNCAIVAQRFDHMGNFTAIYDDALTCHWSVWPNNHFVFCHNFFFHRATTRDNFVLNTFQRFSSSTPNPVPSRSSDESTTLQFDFEHMSTLIM